MKVTLILVQEFYNITGKHKITVELDDKANVRDALEKLPEPVRKRVLCPDNSLCHPVMISVNGRRIEFLNGLETPLKDGDEILVSPRALFVV